MTKERELLQNALELLMRFSFDEPWDKQDEERQLDTKALCVDIKSALAQPEPEPVTWRKINGNDYVYCDDMTDFPTHEDFGWQPLYTHPQPERPPLTEDEICRILNDDGDNLNTEYLISNARAIEAAVWERVGCK
jgi:hypothetical protein